MLGSIIGALGGNIVDSLLGKITGVFESYFKKEISMEELRTKVLQSLLSTFSEIEKAHADSIAKTFDSFMRAAAQSKIMQVVWASVAISQLLVLLWHQVGIPAFVYFAAVKYPSSGATVDWAYALLMFCLGGGAVALRMGSASSSGIVDQLKGLIAKR